MFYGDIRLFWKSLFRENVITTTDKSADYNESHNYQDLNPNTNSNYRTNYQELKLPCDEEENQYQNTTL